MTLIVNGEPTPLNSSAITVSEFLRATRIDYPVLVELNGTALFPREFEKTILSDGDRLEILRMVAGG